MEDIVFDNDYGTAPITAVQKDGKTVIMLPGVPRELIPMFNEKIKNRDRFMACENKELEFESIDDVEYAIDEAFEQVKVIKVEIPW